MSSLAANYDFCKHDNCLFVIVGKVIVGSVSGDTRFISSSSRRLYVFVILGKTTTELCALRAALGSEGLHGKALLAAYAFFLSLHTSHL